MTNKRFLSFILAILTLLLLFSLSSVSAVSYNLTDSNSTGDFQNVIDTDTGTDLVINLDEGTYTFSQINISRNIVIQGKNENTRITGTGTGTLFNITAANVTIINLTITGYQTAVMSNSSSLNILDNDITTSDISINISSTGDDLRGIIIENNNIVSSVSNLNYGVIYISAPQNSGVIIEIFLIGNNITGNGPIDSMGVRFNAPGCVSNLTFENNNIRGTLSYAVSLNVDGSNNANILFTKNNITATLSYCVHIRAYRINNTNITFTNNNITGTRDDVRLYADMSNNSNIIFTNNNLTGTYGVNLEAANINNINIIFTNNNLTGTYSRVILYTSSSNNINIIFTNNNLTATYDYGVILYSTGFNNTNIIFTNNNITGKEGVILSTYRSNVIFTNNNITGIDGGGVYLYASSSFNSTNITFTNNNITGNYGVWMYASGINNTNITFDSNSIHGSHFTFNITSNGRFGGFGSGLYLLNNNLTSDDIGLYFLLGGAFVSDVFIIGNNIIAVNKGICFEEFSSNSNPCSVNLTVNYNRILANVGLDFTTNDDGSNFDYNWWGINDISSKVIGFDTNNHYILNITNLTSLADVSPDDKVAFAFLVLNTTLTNFGVENLPYFVINGTFNGVAYDTSCDDLFLYEFTILVEGLQTIDASLDDEYVALKFNAFKITTSSTIVVPADARVGKTINISGVLTDDDGNSIGNVDINVTVDGKIYTVRTDSNGYWTLSYKPEHTGNIVVSVSLTGDNRYSGFSNASSFNVGKGKVNINITLTENPDGSITIIANVTDEDGDPLADFPVDFDLNGEIVGSGVTNENCIASINIPANKLNEGKNTITISVNGGSNYNNAIDASVAITRLSASSTIIVSNAILGKPTTIKGVAKGQNGKPLANVKLTVTIDGKVYIVTTNNVGEWSLVYIPTKIANIQVTVALNQNNVYYAFSKTASFRVIQTVTLSISAPTINQGKKTNIKLTLKDANSNILKGKKVSITINKKTYTAITNNNGIATFKIANLKGGKYTVIATFAGDNDYKSLNVSGIQKVNRKVNLGITSIKKIKSSNKKNPKYKITIINKGSLKSKATILSIFHIRNGIKIKTKYFKVKAIAPGKKISIIVDYFSDRAKHSYCIAHFKVGPKNKNNEILLANNKKSISLKH